MKKLILCVLAVFTLSCKSSDPQVEYQWKITATRDCGYTFDRAVTYVSDNEDIAESTRLSKYLSWKQFYPDCEVKVTKERVIK